MNKIKVDELLCRRMARFQNISQTTKFKEVSLCELVSEIEGSSHASLISKIRDTSDKSGRDALKKKLPTIAISGVGERKRGKSEWQHSGLLQADIDLTDNPHLSQEEIKNVMENDPHCVCAFKSPSFGVKGILAIEPYIESHISCFNVAREFYESTLSLKLDTAPKNHKSLCFLSHDPAPFIRSGEVEVFHPSFATQKHSNIESQNHRFSDTQKSSHIEEDIYESPVQLVHFRQQIRRKEMAWMQNSDSIETEVLLWKEFVFERYEPNLSQRNKLLCDFVAYSLSRMSKECTLMLTRRMRDLWDCICTDSLTTHQQEAKSQWRGCEETLLQSFNPDEKTIYNFLPDERYKATFRICRDLASVGNRAGGTGKFFLSSRMLGLRLGIHHTQAWRFLRMLKMDGIIRETKTGTKGLNGSASEFLWLLSNL